MAATRFALFVLLCPLHRLPVYSPLERSKEDIRNCNQPSRSTAVRRSSAYHFENSSTQMGLVTEIPSENATSSATSSPSSIIDRKPSPTTSAVAAAPRPSRLSASDDDGVTLRSSASSCKLNGSLEASPSRQLGSGTISAGVDSDCPTFLDYQRYFSQGSLARCLDEPRATAVSPVKNTEASTTMLCKGQLQTRKCEEPAENQETTFGEERSPAEVAAL
ncbi:hypothetical protein LLEC1_06154 [Akanthomyces lecanii]|uniref:Uncharacterized protein n=1 Tax=Cordyceps confragosa TaxID=2714763 RepID=A0A179IAJ8_CORDF|nr:hypothetical protein LLEC1_06154 [Akanthomyces lecanii]